MRPQKLSKEQIQLHCMQTFKTHGYAGTSMDLLAKSCGLSKATFYYYYPNKEALVLDILQVSQQYLNHKLFSILCDTHLDYCVRFEHLHQQAVSFFSMGVQGCLVGMLSLEVPHLSEQIHLKIQSIFQDWELALLHYFQQVMPIAQAEALAKISVADYEGAILMTRLKQDDFYLTHVAERILKQLSMAVMDVVEA
ncbi:TetR/AcrR family transcriptional regulator [Acinetobacter johnsonii]|uniref:TetR/AcrR family transcriptional regulator n=1 Tax=Acinetobacter johnsonii TaxID=40214 RepID=UPI00300B4451